MLVPGDRVEAHILEDGGTLVDRVLPRDSALARRTVEGRSKTLAANADAIVTVTSLAHPPPRLLILDQLLAYAELEDVAALVVFTKPDLDEGGIGHELTELYSWVGYETLTINPKIGLGVEALRAWLAGRRALLSGVSGVGKSTIFRALGGQSAVGDLSRQGLGRQTTTSARLYRTSGGFLIDSPGVTDFGLGAVGRDELGAAFREMPALAAQCRFRDCTHLREPDCAVRAAVASGALPESRYASYCRILEGGDTMRPVPGKGAS